MKYKTVFKIITFGAILIAASFLVTSSRKAFASATYSVSPMNQRISLTPGETYHGTFKVTNLAISDSNVHYKLKIEPFAIDNNNEFRILDPDDTTDYNQIVNWITLIEPEGYIEPNNTRILKFDINVPENAPAGGQYAAIMVSSLNEEDGREGAVTIKNNYQIAHVLYADVAGETIRHGDIANVKVPSFLFSGKITGSAIISNTGNVHSDATHTLQVFPLFSDEEIYTNEETPSTNLIMPGAARLTSVSWEETPSIGIFHVIYNVEYEGVESKVDKMVIVCPLWLLFLILLALFLIIFKIIWGKKKEKK